VNGLVFDAGGLIALERDDRKLYALIQTAVKRGARLVIPATALAQVIRNPAQQVRLLRAIQSRHAQIVPLDRPYAHSVGLLLAKSGTSDIADAHVVACAMATEFAIVTSDPFDMKRLHPGIQTITV
jgi:hypothetical protein